MNSATSTVRLVKGSKTVRFEMTEGSKTVEFFNSMTRREIGRTAAKNKIASYLSKGYAPVAS